MFTLIISFLMFIFCGDDTNNNPANPNGTSTTVTTAVITSDNPLSYVYYSLVGIPIELNSDDLANSNKTIANYSWDFESDGTYDYTGASSATSKSFDTEGTKEMLLKITYNDNSLDVLKIRNIVRDNTLNYYRLVWTDFSQYT